jgi:hypothetical protein
MLLLVQHGNMSCAHTGRMTVQYMYVTPSDRCYILVYIYIYTQRVATSFLDYEVSVQMLSHIRGTVHKCDSLR